MTRLATGTVIRLLLVLATAPVFQGPATAQTTRPKIEVSKLGPQVGDRVSDFSLNDQHGKTWTRQSIMGPKGAMLVFIRSAEW